MDNWYYISPQEYEESKRKYNLNANTIYQRVYKNGWSKKEALTTPNKKENLKIPKEFVEIALRNGIARQTLDNRISRGWTLEDAITIKQGKPGRKRIFEDWIYEKAKENNLSMDIVRYRIKNLKWDKLRACTEAVQRR